MKRRCMLDQIPAESPKYSVTIQVRKDGLVYSSSATLPNITFNNETQTVNPNGNTFENVEEGEYAVSVTSTSYNDAYSGNITVDSSNTSFKIDVRGLYDWAVSAYYYPDNNSSKSRVNAGGLTVKLALSSSTSEDDYLYSGTTNSDGTVKITSYKIRNDITYDLRCSSQKLSNGAYILSISSRFDYLESGQDSMNATISLTLASYQIQISLYKDTTNDVWKPSTYPTVSITSTAGTTTSAGGYSNGVAVFNSIPYSSSFTVNVGSTTYNNALTTSISPITGLAAAYASSVVLTGKYYIKVELYNSLTGTWFRNCSILVYLQNASGTNLGSTTTDSGGDALFNSSSNYLFTYGSTVKIYVPAQTVTNTSGTTYVLQSTTFTKVLNTSYATISNVVVNKDTAYFKALSVTTTEKTNDPVYITRTIPFADNLNNICTETGTGWANINYTGTTFTPTYYTTIGVASYSNDESYASGWESHNAYATYAIGGKVLWKSKPWTMVVHMYGTFNSSSFSGSSNIGFGVKCNSNCTSISDAALYIKANDSGKVSYTNVLTYIMSSTSSINSVGEYNIGISYNPDTNKISVSVEAGSTSVGSAYPVTSISDDDSNSYFLLALGPAFTITSVEFAGYIQ